MNNDHHPTLQERMERLELVVAMVASVVTRQQLPQTARGDLDLYVAQIAAEVRGRETAAHLPEPEL